MLKAYSRSCSIESRDLGLQPPAALQARPKACGSTMTRLRSGQLKVEQRPLADGSTRSKPRARASRRRLDARLRARGAAAAAGAEGAAAGAQQVGHRRGLRSDDRSDLHPPRRNRLEPAAALPGPDRRAAERHRPRAGAAPGRGAGRRTRRPADQQRPAAHAPDRRAAGAAAGPAAARAGRRCASSPSACSKAWTWPASSRATRSCGRSGCATMPTMPCPKAKARATSMRAWSTRCARWRTTHDGRR